GGYYWRVEFERFGSYLFTEDGKYMTDSPVPSIFHNEVKAEDWPDPAPPLPDLKVDDPIWVRDHDHEEWRRRHFKCWNDGRVVAYANGGTSWSTNSTTTWNRWR